MGKIWHQNMAYMPDENTGMAQPMGRWVPYSGMGRIWKLLYGQGRAIIHHWVESQAHNPFGTELDVD